MQKRFQHRNPPPREDQNGTAVARPAHGPSRDAPAGLQAFAAARPSGGRQGGAERLPSFRGAKTGALRGVALVGRGVTGSRHH